MDEQLSQPPRHGRLLGKRKPQRGGKGKKKAKVPREIQRATKKVQDNKKTRRLIRKRIREYNSDDEEEEEGKARQGEEEGEDASEDDEESESEGDGNRMEDGYAEGSSDEEAGDMQQGITKFAEGSRAFKNAFAKIMKKNVSTTDPLGPILSAHKKLVAEKLAEELEEKKVKVEAKKEKRLLAEKGHVQPANYLDSKEKFLISVATKGVVKLFNAVNKAQHSQRGLSSSKAKDAREFAKRRKRAFLSELRKPAAQANDEENKEPAWAPLRDNYMLTNSKFKNWDKIGDTDSQPQKTPLDSSDEE